MKKFIALLLALLFTVGTLTACQSSNDLKDTQKQENGAPPSTTESTATSLPEGMSGTDAVKLLLANERLNSALLKDSENIFNSGADALKNLSAKAKENFENTVYSSDSFLKPLSANVSSESNVTLLSNKITSVDGSYVEIDGNRYVWKNLAESSDSYSYFENITLNVASTAEQGAELIDDIKKNVRVVDKWVKVASGSYFLHVEDNMELLLFKDANTEGQDIACRRYKNENGANVYEIYMSNYVGESRMIYIPGQKCEYSFEPRDGGNHDFLAENTKGFWEVVDVRKLEEDRYDLSCMVLKDDICYDASYNPQEKFVNMLKVISADKKTDIIGFSQDKGSQQTNVTLNLQGFDGIDRIEVVDTNGSGIYQNTWEGHTMYTTTASADPTVVTSNGTSIKANDAFLDGNVSVVSIYVTHKWQENGGIYIANMDITINSNDYEEIINILNDFMALVGISCRRDMNYVSQGITQASLELQQFTKYHQWNESSIETNETLAVGFANRAAKFKAWRDEYEAVKDVEVIDYNDTKHMELNMHFSPVAVSGHTTADGLKVSVNELSLSVSDTLLFVKDEPYTVNFAFLGIGETDGTLTIIEIDSLKETSFNGEKTFSAAVSASFELPVLAEGTYTLVAYVSTSDGIRSSEYTAVAFEELIPVTEKHVNAEVSTERSNDGTLKLTVKEILDVEVTVNTPESGAHSYQTMFDALAQHAYLYGFAEEGATVERKNDDGTWTALLGTEEQLESGTYRLKYSIKNGESLKSGTVFTSYVKAEELPSEQS